MSLLEEHNNTGSVETGFEQGGAGFLDQMLKWRHKMMELDTRKKNFLPNTTFRI